MPAKNVRNKQIQESGRERKKKFGEKRDFFWEAWICPQLERRKNKKMNQDFRSVLLLLHSLFFGRMKI